VRDDALREIIGGDLVRQGELFDARNQSVVAANGAFQEAFVSEAIEASLLAVALAARPNQRQVARAVAGQKPPLDGGEQNLGIAVAAISGRRHHVAIADQGDRVIGRDHLLECHDPFLSLARRRLGAAGARPQRLISRSNLSAATRPDFCTSFRMPADDRRRGAQTLAVLQMTTPRPKLS
jgi:hypothetical protein